MLELLQKPERETERPVLRRLRKIKGIRKFTPDQTPISTVQDVCMYVCMYMGMCNCSCDNIR